MKSRHPILNRLLNGSTASAAAALLELEHILNAHARLRPHAIPDDVKAHWLELREAKYAHLGICEAARAVATETGYKYNTIRPYFGKRPARDSLA